MRMPPSQAVPTRLQRPLQYWQPLAAHALHALKVAQSTAGQSAVLRIAGTVEHPVLGALHDPKSVHQLQP